MTTSLERKKSGYKKTVSFLKTLLNISFFNFISTKIFKIKPNKSVLFVNK